MGVKWKRWEEMELEAEWWEELPMRARYVCVGIIVVLMVLTVWMVTAAGLDDGTPQQVETGP